MGKGWIRTPEQEEYLEGEFQSYLKARNDGEVKNWRSKLHDKWEERWPERQVLINEWKLPDNTTFNTAQMETLGKALSARKKVRCILNYNSTFYSTFISSSNCTITSVGEQMQNQSAQKPHKAYSLATCTNLAPRNPHENVQFLKSTVTVTISQKFKAWLTRS